MPVFLPEDPKGILAFAPGAGGDPARYLALIHAAVDAGHIVVAPTHERFDGRTVTNEQMRERAIGLRDAIAQAGRPDLPVVAAGHSAGGWAAVCLAGGLPRGREGEPLPVPKEPRVSRVVLLAPTLGWFQGPGSLDRLSVPVVALVGDEDAVTPPSSVEILKDSPAEVRIRRYAGAGHFDFMSELPPGLAPTAGLDHEEFVRRLTADFVDALER